MNWKTPVTLVVLILMVVGGSVIGWHYATQDMPSLRDAAEADKPTVTCETLNRGQALEAGAVTVNVYNTPKGVPNMAGTTLTQFVERGFLGGTAEDSERVIPERRVLLTAEDPKSPQVQLVRKQLKGEVPVRAADEAVTRGEVNVYVGSRFRGLLENTPTEVRVREGTLKYCYEVDEQ
jgi:hypothetical protein